ncbi:BTB domain containing 11 [Aphelenchoides avenae]|nr:BTB domain containing 11 [Aphelenchus avenae]
MEGGPSLVVDVAWVQRGVAKSVPQKIEVEKEDLQNLLQGDGEETSEDDEDKPSADEATLEEDKRQGLRGSATDLDLKEVAEGVEKYRLDDDEEEDTVKGPSIKGLACYASPLDDPYITQHVDSDEEEERDDFVIKANDNLLDEYSLEVYVYNEDNEDWYLHHDYILDAPPLCLAPFSYDPGTENNKGNLVAVGTMDSQISVWDLDIVNAMSPVLTLGESGIGGKKKKKAKGGKARKKRDGSAQTHTDAVLCVDWNRVAEHVLASGSADTTVILWDLDEAKPATVLNHFGGMVQSLQWHPVEQSIVLSGTRAGGVHITDCRNTEATASAEWSFGDGVEVEKVLWDHFNPFCSFACFDDGMLRYLDSRKPGEPVIEVMAHEEGANSVSQSYVVKGMITSVGQKELKVWRLQDGTQLVPVYTHVVNMGNVNTVKFAPDGSGNIIAVGAESEEMVRTFDLEKFEQVRASFSAQAPAEDVKLEMDMKMESDD